MFIKSFNLNVCKKIVFLSSKTSTTAFLVTEGWVMGIGGDSGGAVAGLGVRVRAVCGVRRVCLWFGGRSV